MNRWYCVSPTPLRVEIWELASGSPCKLIATLTDINIAYEMIDNRIKLSEIKKLLK